MLLRKCALTIMIPAHKLFRLFVFFFFQKTDWFNEQWIDLKDTTKGCTHSSCYQRIRSGLSIGVCNRCIFFYNPKFSTNWSRFKWIYIIWRLIHINIIKHYSAQCFDEGYYWCRDLDLKNSYRSKLKFLVVLARPSWLLWRVRTGH